MWWPQEPASAGAKDVDTTCNRQERIEREASEAELAKVTPHSQQPRCHLALAWPGVLPWRNDFPRIPARFAPKAMTEAREKTKPELLSAPMRRAKRAVEVNPALLEKAEQLKTTLEEEIKALVPTFGGGGGQAEYCFVKDKDEGYVAAKRGATASQFIGEDGRPFTARPSKREKAEGGAAGRGHVATLKGQDDSPHRGVVGVALAPSGPARIVSVSRGLGKNNGKLIVHEPATGAAALA